MDKGRRLLWIAGAAIGSLVVALVLAWKFSPLADVLAARNIEGWLEAISSRWWTPLLLAALYTPAAIVMFPRPLLTLAAVAVFGPWKGFALAMTGVLVSAVVGYVAGRMIDEKRVRKLAGPRLDRIARVLRREGFMAMTAVGLLPIAPFAIEMMVAGALRIKLRDVLGGVFVAMLPGMVGTTIIGHQLIAAVHGEGRVNPWIVAATLAALAAFGWGTRRWWKRVQAQLDEGPTDKTRTARS